MSKGFSELFFKPGFNPRSSHTKDSKMVLDTTLLNTQHYQARIKGKVEQSCGNGAAPPPQRLGVVAIEMGAFGSPSTKVANFTYFKEVKKNKEKRKKWCNKEQTMNNLAWFIIFCFLFY